MLERIEALRDFLWGGFLPALLLGAGIFCCACVRAYPFRRFVSFVRGLMRGEQEQGRGGVSPFQALCVSLGATVGTGNIAGVATALAFGGPGAVFWMWVTGLVSMGTAFCEQTLGVLYRRREADGTFSGGPMHYLASGLGSPRLAQFFALCLVPASLGMGCLTQANAMAQALSGAAGVPPLACGALAAGVVYASLRRGLSGLTRVLERLTPLMAGLYVLFCVSLLVACRAHLPGVLADILRGAFCLRAGVSGAAGYSVLAALRAGALRGVLSNEAGLGSSVLIGVQANVKNPCEQGMWGALQVFLDTLMLCTLTALCILSSGAFDARVYAAARGTPQFDALPQGAALSVQAAVRVFGAAGGLLVAVGLTLFALSTLLGWSYYGRRGLAYLAHGRGDRLFCAVFSLCAVLGSVLSVRPALALGDLAGGLMAMPNLAGVLLLSGAVRRAAARSPKAACRDREN